MAKTITVKYNNATYTLQFTRRTVSMMEKNGFKLDELSSKPVSISGDLFAGSFIARHSNVKRDVINKIYAAQEPKSKLIEKLIDMYMETIDFLKNDEINEDGEEPTPTFEANF